MAGKAKKKGKKKGKSVVSWQMQIMMLFIFLLALVFHPTTVLLFIGMMPTMIAVVVDRTKETTRGLTVGAMNFAGCAPFILDLWTGENNIGQAMQILFDPRTIIVMYCAAGIGYLIDWAVSGIVGNVLVQQSKGRLQAIERRQDEMVDRWGREVTGEIPLDARGFPLEDDALPKSRETGNEG